MQGDEPVCDQCGTIIMSGEVYYTYTPGGDLIQVCVDCYRWLVG